MGRIAAHPDLKTMLTIVDPGVLPWGEKTGIQEPPGLGGKQQFIPGHFRTFNQANAINEDGRIAGVSTAPEGTLHAVLWRSEND